MRHSTCWLTGGALAILAAGIAWAQLGLVTVGVGLIGAADVAGDFARLVDTEGRDHARA